MFVCLGKKVLAATRNQSNPEIEPRHFSYSTANIPLQVDRTTLTNMLGTGRDTRVRSDDRYTRLRIKQVLPCVSMSVCMCEYVC